MNIRTILVDREGQDVRPLYANADGQINATSQKDLLERLIELLTKWGVQADVGYRLYTRRACFNFKTA